MYLNLDSLDVWNNYILYICYQFHPWKKIIQTPKKNNKCCEDELSEATQDDHPDDVTVEEKRRSSEALGFVSRFAVVYGFGKPGKSAAAAAITLTTQGEMCI